MNFKQPLLLCVCAALAVTACGESATSVQGAAPANSIAAVHQDAAANDNAQKPSSKELNVLKTNLSSKLSQSGFEAKIKSVKPTEIPGIFWVQASGTPAFFTDTTGTYVIQGESAKLDGKEISDITSPLKRQAAKETLANVSLENTINFKPKGETKAIVYAFTDVDCGYCRKLHAEMDQINDLGVEVRYLAWPRAQQSVPVMESVWCAKDPKAALTQAKRGESVRSGSCNSPVSEQTQLGYELGVRGTPAIFTTSGEQIGGYLPARQLAKAAIASESNN